MTRDRHTGGFNLVGSQVRALKSLESIIAEIEFITSLRKTPVVTALNLSVLYSFWH